jgi:hypothetical protein
MISDWSGAAVEYAFGLGKPVVFIDTPRKVNNSEYEELDIEPFESKIRTVVGEIVPQDGLDTLGEVVHRLLENSSYKDMQEVAAKHVFNVGRSGEVGAKALQQILADLPS